MGGMNSDNKNLEKSSYEDIGLRKRTRNGLGSGHLSTGTGQLAGPKPWKILVSEGKTDSVQDHTIMSVSN